MSLNVNWQELEVIVVVVPPPEAEFSTDLLVLLNLSKLSGSIGFSV
jgi:hypothetical protein